MTLSHEVKDCARSAGFSAAGIIGRDRFASLPVGPVADVITLNGPEGALSGAQSMIVLGLKIWDAAFNLAAIRPEESGGSDFHQLYSDGAAAKAWEVAHFLWSRGHEAVVAPRMCLKKAAVLAGIGAQGKNTVVVSPEHGTSLRFAAVLTSAALDEDAPFERDLCGDCAKCIDSCPTKALAARSIEIERCMVYAAENPRSARIGSEVREAERRFIRRPTENSFIECTICLAACPIGSARGSS